MRSGFNYTDFRYSNAFVIPEGDIESEEHAFHLETVINDLDPQSFSIAPLPDGRILLTEKKLGLSIVSTDGLQSALIQGTPKTYADTYIPVLEQEWGLGWMLDVAVHPEYENNKWVYIHFGDRCSECNEFSRNVDRPVSMNKLIRGRIQDGKWVEQIPEKKAPARKKAPTRKKAPARKKAAGKKKKKKGARKTDTPSAKATAGRKRAPSS